MVINMVIEEISGMCPFTVAQENNTELTSTPDAICYLNKVHRSCLSSLCVFYTPIYKAQTGDNRSCDWRDGLCKTEKPQIKF